VAGVLDARGVGPGPGRDEILAAAAEAGHQAGVTVGEQLLVLARTDVDAQATTPLSVLRAVAAVPTAVLLAADVAPAARDRFAEERFPDDPYGLVPASVAAVDPGLHDAALAWGAAKAMAHRRRHGGSR
jgi:hypothetical protein